MLCLSIVLGQTDMKQLKAGLQSSQHTEFCIVFVYCVRSDGHAEDKGRSAEQSTHSIVFIYGVQVRQT